MIGKQINFNFTHLQMSSRGQCFLFGLKMSMQLWESRLYYLSGQRDFNRHRYQLCQEAAIEGHHEHHRVTVWKNKCDLQRRDDACVTVHL